MTISISKWRERGRLVLRVGSNDTIWIDGHPLVISDKLIDERCGCKSFFRWGASIQIFKDGYDQRGRRFVKLVCVAPKDLPIHRDVVNLQLQIENEKERTDASSAA